MSGKKYDLVAFILLLEVIFVLCDLAGMNQKKEEDRIKAEKERYAQLGNCTNKMCIETCKEFKYPFGGECFKYACQCIYVPEETMDVMQGKTTLKPGEVATTDRSQIKYGNDYSASQENTNSLLPPGAEAFINNARRLGRRKNKIFVNTNILHSLKIKRQRRTIRGIEDKYWDTKLDGAVLLRESNGFHVINKRL